MAKNGAADSLDLASSKSEWSSCFDALSSTVPAVHAALHTSAASGGGGRFGISDVEARPRECVWVVALHVSRPRRRRGPFPASTKGDPPSASGEAAGGERFDLPVRVTCLRAEGNRCRVELSLEGHVPLWDTHAVDITLAMDWMRRMIQRSVRRGLSCIENEVPLPVVSLHLPEVGSSPAEIIESLQISTSEDGGECRSCSTEEADVEMHGLSSHSNDMERSTSVPTAVDEDFDDSGLLSWNFKDLDEDEEQDLAEEEDQERSMHINIAPSAVNIHSNTPSLGNSPTSPYKPFLNDQSIPMPSQSLNKGCTSGSSSDNSALPVTSTKADRRASMVTPQTASTSSLDEEEEMADEGDEHGQPGDNSDSPLHVKIIRALKQASSGGFTAEAIHQTKCGRMSQKSMEALSGIQIKQDLTLPCQNGAADGGRNNDKNVANLVGQKASRGDGATGGSLLNCNESVNKCQHGDIDESEQHQSFDREFRMTRKGCMSPKSLDGPSGREADVGESVENRQDENIERENQCTGGKLQGGDGGQSEQHEHIDGEIRMALKGCMSRETVADFRRKGIITSFSDENISSRRKGGPRAGIKKNADVDKVLAASAGAGMRATNIEEDGTKHGVTSSDSDRNDQPQDILTEGQCYLGISMLVYMYSYLRETCRMGHTMVKMKDIDVNSLQSQYQKGPAKRYLKRTKTVGFIIRVVVDELDRADADSGEHTMIGRENKEYERSIKAQFRKWIQDSRISQIDVKNEKMIAEMQKEAARRRWRRSSSAVRLSVRLRHLSDKECPNSNGVVVAPVEGQTHMDKNARLREAVARTTKYFRNGSVMQNIMESGIEMVWFSDMSQNDVVYAICVQRKEKRVTVAFRGTVNAHNWQMNLKFDTSEYRNPIEQNYPGRMDELSLHSGFALYLLRKRMDTQMSTLQVILDKVEEIGRELAPDGDFHLAITGHSMGGALATLCGFYAAAGPRFANLRVDVWTFAAPRVGTLSFLHAWQHLERTGRIRHARFSVTHDFIPLVPFCNFQLNSLQFYKHVGLRVQLHNIGRIGKWQLQKRLDVTYPLHHGWRSEIKRAFMNSFFANLATPSGFKRNHSLTEYQKRLHFAMNYRRALGSGVNFCDKKRNHIKTLDEYYHIRANISTDGIHGVTATEAQGPCGRSRVLVLLFVFLLSLAWLVLIASVKAELTGSDPFSIQVILSPIAIAISSVRYSVSLPFTLYVAMCRAMPHNQAGKAMSSFFRPAHEVKRTAFIGRTAFTGRRRKSEANHLISKLATLRAEHYMVGMQQKLKMLANQNGTTIRDSAKLQSFESTAEGLFSLAALVDG